MKKKKPCLHPEAPKKEKGQDIDSSFDSEILSQTPESNEKGIKESYPSLPSLMKIDIVFAKELLIRGILTLKDINDCYKNIDESEKDMPLAQIMIRRRLISVYDFMKISKDLDSWDKEELKERYREGPVLSVRKDGDTMVLEQKSGFKKIGHYEIIREIGSGGMGIVYAARDTTLDRVVALKTLKSANITSSSDLERFRREARLTASLNHPGIVAVHDIGIHDGVPYYTMDYIHALSLDEYVKEVNPSLQELVRIICDITKALAFAHSKEIIHRDIKPSNILVDSEGVPHITDFGLARQINVRDKLTVSGIAVGTPAYMSPEQATGTSHEVTKASDVYSLGAVIYELLVGRPPFWGESAAKVIASVIFQDPVPPRSINKSIPRDLETICMKCLEKDSKRRYHNGKAIVLDLERYQKGEPIHAKSAGIIYKSSKWILRNKLLAASIFFIITFFSTFIYVFFLAPAKLTIITKARVEGKIEQVCAGIEVDGCKIDSSTLKSIYVSSGYHRVSLSLKDHLPVDFLIKTSPREEIKLEKEFIHEKGYINITSPHSQIEASFINKSSKSVTRVIIPVYNYEIDTGDYEIIFNKRNYFELKKEVTIQKDVPIYINVELEPMLMWSMDVSQKPDVSSIALTDLDMDGEIELICTSSGKISSYDLKKRERVWSLSHSIMGGASPIVLRDMNRDGIPDILCANPERFMVIDGKTHEEIFNRPIWWGREFTTKDINGDGYEDLILMCYYQIECHDLKNRKMLCSFSKPERDSPSPVFIDDLHMIYGITGKLYRVDIRTGKAEAVFSYEGKGSPPRIHQATLENSMKSVLLWYTNDKGMYCIDRNSFKTIWYWPFQIGNGNVSMVLYPQSAKRQAVLVHLDRLYCLSVETGEVIWSFDTHNTGTGSAPSVADLDGDGTLEIVVTNSDGTLFVLDGKQGKLLGKFIGTDVGQHLLADSNGDGVLEIFLISGQSVYCIRPIQDHRIKVLTEDNIKPSGTPVFFDLNGDNKLDLLVGDSVGELHFLDGKDWKQVWSRKLGKTIITPVALADIDGDKEPEIIVNTDNAVMALKKDGKDIWCKKQDKFENLRNPVIADLDKDGYPEIIAASYTGTISCLRGKTGEILWQCDAKRIFSPPCVADADNDGWLDVLSMCGIHFWDHSYAFCFDGRDGKQKWIGETPCHEEGRGGILVKDTDQDGYPEVFAKQCGGYITCFEGKNGNVRWEKCFRGGDIKEPSIFKDFDNDGQLELINSNGDGQILCIDPRTGKEKWRQSTGAELAARNHPYIEVCDINNDLVPDIISTSHEHSLFTCSGKDGGWLGYLDSLGPVIGPLNLLDLNQDGRTDLVFFDRSYRIICIYDIIGYLNKSFYPDLSIYSIVQDGSILHLAFLNRLIRNKAYKRLESELEKYSAKFVAWDHVINFYRGLCAFSKRETEKALQFFKACQQSSSNIFDNKFMMAVISIDKGEDRDAYSLIKTLLETSVIEFERCYQKYKDLITEANRVKLRNILCSAIKESRCEEKLVKAYEYAAFMNRNEDIELILPLCLKYGSSETSGYKERYKQYVDRIIQSTQQYTSLYSQHRSLDILDKALEVLPESSELLAKRGMQYLITGISQENGLADLRKSLEFNPSQPDLLLYIGQIMYTQRQYKEALENIEASINLNPKDAKIRLAKVLILLTIKETKSARSELERISQETTIPKNHPTGHIYKILLSLCDNKREEAIRELEILQTRFPQTFRTWLCINILKMLNP